MNIKKSSFIETFITCTSLKHPSEMRGGEKSIFCLLRFLDLFTRVGYRLRLHLNCLQVLTPFIVYKVEAIIKAIMLVRHYSQRFKKKKRKKRQFWRRLSVFCHARLRAHAFPLKQRMRYKATLQSCWGKNTRLQD